MSSKDRWLTRGAFLTVSVLRGIVLLAGATFVAFFVDVVVARLRFPVDIEFMIGAILDHVERVQQHLPLYVAPSADWVPFLYPPGYYWLSALVGRFTPLMLACRVVSLVGTAVAAGNVGILARRIGASRFWSVTAVGLFFGAYSFTGYWYDIERCDSLFVALLSASALLLSWETTPLAAAAGVTLGLAFFVKQPASLFLICVTVGLFLGASKKRALAFLIPGAAIMAGGVAALDAATHGWYSFYCFKVPAGHGIEPEYWRELLLEPFEKVVPLMLVTLTAFGFLARALLRRVKGAAKNQDGRTIVFGSWMLAAFVSSVMSRLHPGGALNVFMFWSTSACVATAVVATHLEARTSARSALWGATGAALGMLLVLYQFARFNYDPKLVSPTQAQVDGAALIAGRIHDLERRGEVFVEGRGHLSTKRHLHTAAIVDLVRGGFDAPASLVSNIDHRIYAAIVLDKIDALKMRSSRETNVRDLQPNLLRNYFIAERLPDVAYPTIGFYSQPTWVFLPRSAPLEGISNDELVRRANTEASVAEEQMNRPAK
ncbi:MAG TPA: hypothetical protein VNO21_01585 [Polyangiaceae bacterium]|nr:hypothetical protein [Polyangiaceae bacterium]